MPITSLSINRMKLDKNSTQHGDRAVVTFIRTAKETKKYPLDNNTVLTTMYTAKSLRRFK